MAEKLEIKLGAIGCLLLMAFLGIAVAIPIVIVGYALKVVL